MPVAAVTVSMETSPAQLHPGDHDRGGRGDVSPSPPHGDTLAPGVHYQPPGERENGNPSSGECVEESQGN